MTPDEYCQQKAASSGSSFYNSFRFLPPLKRRAITALYAFCREVDDVVDECSDESIARQTLYWWRQEVGNLYQGQPEHPVTRALLPLLDSFNLPQEYLLEIIDGMEMDLYQHEYADFKALSLYCYRVASVVGLLTVEIFGYQNRQTLRYAHDLGMAFQLTNILRDVREDAMRGRVYIPQDEMKKFGVSQHDLHQPISNDATHALFQFQADRARDYYRKAFALLPDEDRYSQLSGLLMAEIYSALLDEIEADGFRVLEHKIKLSPSRKLYLSLRCFLREKFRHWRNSHKS